MKLSNLCLSITLIFFATLLKAQDKVKIALDGNDKVEFVTNNIGDLRYNILSSGSGSDNLFFGQNTGININHSSGSEGYYNTAVGNFSFAFNTIGYGNSAFGRSALNSNSTGYYNLALGAQALSSNQIGFRNAGFGFGAMQQNVSGNDNIAIGVNSLFSNVGKSKNIAIGNFAMENADNTSTLLEGRNIAIGYEALKGSSTPTNNTGTENISIGSQSMLNNTSGLGNVAIGPGTLHGNSMGSYNTSLGHSSLQQNTEGSRNVAIGHLALFSGQTGIENVAIGAQAGLNSRGSNNVFIGYKAGLLETSTGSNKLYIDNSGASSSEALIYGEFDNEYLRMNANLEVYGVDSDKPAVKGIIKYPPGVTYSDQPGVYGENTVDAAFGIGVQGKGNYRGVLGESPRTGVRGIATNGLGDSKYGVSGIASVVHGGSNYGVFGQAGNGANNYSIYGYATGSGANDWAGYFQGKVNVETSLHTAKINVGAEGVEFDNNKSVKRAVELKYIIAVGGDFPISDDGNQITGYWSNSIVGEVKLFAGNYAPDGWKFCDGTLLPISTNQALFSILGTRYGGDGQTNFALPNLTEAVPIHY